MGRGDLTETQWRRIEPLLPTQKPRIGRPNKDHRDIINAILWVVRIGAPWRDPVSSTGQALPDRYGPWATVASRFYRWRERDVWQRLLEGLQQEADIAGQLEWGVHDVYGAIVRAHQHPAGTKNGEVTRL